MAKFGFDLDEVEIDVQQDYRPFPKGNYKLQAVEAEEKETAKRNGTYIKVKFEVVSGEHTGRLLWENFNVSNPSEVAQRIGRQQLVAWATACNKPDATDTDVLIGKTFEASVDIEKGTGGYEDSNKIKGYLRSDSYDKIAKVPKAAPVEREEPKAEVKKDTPSNPWD
jgi:hypothetical protein